MGEREATSRLAADVETIAIAIPAGSCAQVPPMAAPLDVQAMSAASEPRPSWLPGGGGFEGAKAEALAGADDHHWWFKSKAEYVTWALRRWPPAGGANAWLADVGAGAGGVTAMLGWRAQRVVALDLSSVLMRRACERHALLGVVGTGCGLPLRDQSAGVVCLLDVIEHLDDPVEVLREARRVLRPDGRVVLSVPAHAWLWSRADELLGHARRYSSALLRRQLVEAGLEPLFMSHVFSWLLPAVWLTRRLCRDSGRQLGLAESSPAIERAARLLSRVERALISGMTLPFGTSILCVAIRGSRG